MKVFRADSSHLEQLSPLFDQYRQFYGKAADPEGCRQFMGARLANDESVVFAATEEGGRIGGFTQLYPSFCSVEMDRLIYLYDLFVAPGSRRRGMARALLEAARGYGIETAAGRLQLETAFDNKAAQALYESLGWKRDEVFYTYQLELSNQ